MLLVAIVAIASAATILVRRSKQYSQIAAAHSAREAATRDLLAMLEWQAASVSGVIEFNVAVRQGPGARIFGSSDGFVAEKDQLDSAIHKYRKLVEHERDVAAAYRRAARYPWLGTPRVPPTPG
jgi:hypothetical protein